METQSLRIHRLLKLTLLAAISVVTTVALPVAAGDGEQYRHAQESGRHRNAVLPARAEPHGYSLADLNRITAAFNVTDHSGAPPALVDGSDDAKFQMLFTTASNAFRVKRNKILYVPVLFSDDSPPVIGQFPNVKNREAVLRYIYGKPQVGLQYSIITIDGKQYPLDERYIAAAKVAPLPDGGGTGAIVSAAFVGPLAKGHHVVEISSSSTGDALAPWCAIVTFCTDNLTFSLAYSVDVD